MDLLLSIIENLDRTELDCLSIATFTGRKNIFVSKIVQHKPTMTKNWVDRKAAHLAGLLDNHTNLEMIKVQLLSRFQFPIVSNVIDNLVYESVLRGRYPGFYKAMLRPITREMIIKYDKVGLARGMPAEICEFALNHYRSKTEKVTIAPTLGFYLLVEDEFPKVMKTAMDTIEAELLQRTSTSLVIGTRWPDSQRNWSHSLLFISDHVRKEVFILDPANEDQWEFQAKSMAEYWEKKEGIPWIVVKRVCPMQKFSGDCNVVTLMIVARLSEGKEIPNEFSKKEIKDYKAKLVALALSSLI